MRIKSRVWLYERLVVCSRAQGSRRQCVCNRGWCLGSKRLGTLKHLCAAKARRSWPLKPFLQALAIGRFC